MFENDLNILLRVFVIVLLSGFLGWERESAGKSAGLRTHILVGISSVLFVVLGEILISKYQGFGDRMRFDPVRIVEAIVTGISFLGAGMIIFNRANRRVKGLTTAAGVLTTSAIGMLVGLERYFLSVGTTLIVFAVLRFVNIFEIRYLDEKKNEGDGPT